ncbi:hypothetical protein SAMN04487943_10781 [Gracilibacillus orientalis]|uniref:Uncharacterized protein n=1 Tax=Gracilibacillus orientalis TaxID=334253 RepID=A0A1I4MT56_9BACI|nr:hypothetical protein [Gracilibacillus orientalis]SFM06491.1 hypothetical protein SAMN04487943_10781 [Gracilibacillus orientalis]
MSSFLLMGVLAIILFLFFRNPIIKKIEVFGTLQLNSEKHKWLNFRIFTCLLWLVQY